MSIDWNEQWTLFAENFRDGFAHIPIGNQILRLKPGPGFGDLSHPTTKLMIAMMKDLVHGTSVIDIGCGSGILTLAALLMGAKSAVGVDIDLEAIQHTKENAKLNGLKVRVGKKIPHIATDNVMLMNMIFSEQKSVEPEKYHPKLWIISGILASQRDAYLLQTEGWGWKPIQEHNDSDWLGFVFNTTHLN